MKDLFRSHVIIVNLKQKVTTATCFQRVIVFISAGDEDAYRKRMDENSLKPKLGPVTFNTYEFNS